MGAAQPDVSVVVATHDRRERLDALIAGLRGQSLSPDRFELVVVDDGSGDGTAELLEQEAKRPDLSLRWIRRPVSAGPATARDVGWRASRGRVIAFTDDDCVPSPEWLTAVLAAAERYPGTIIQGRTEPMPWELDRLGPFSRTIRVTAPDAAYQTCNVVYPRDVLERIGGFDTEAFGRSPGGEDSDLAWRAIKSGAPAEFVPEALVYHAVNELGPMGKLRVAGRWTTPMLAYVRHPELRRAHFFKGVFWKLSHYLLLRLVVALLLPRRLRWMAPWLAYPYLHELGIRVRQAGAGPTLIPYLVLHDIVEVITVGRAAARYRHPMI